MTNLIRPITQELADFMDCDSPETSLELAVKFICKYIDDNNVPYDKTNKGVLYCNHNLKQLLKIQEGYILTNYGLLTRIKYHFNKDNIARENYILLADFTKLGKI
jgi:hypothetical protein